MWPSLREGDDAEMGSTEEHGLREGDVAVARVAGQLVIHRVLAVGEGFVRLRGDNASQSDPPIPREQILGVVTRLRRAGRVLAPRQWKSRPGALRRFSLRIRDRLVRAISS